MRGRSGKVTGCPVVPPIEIFNESVRMISKRKADRSSVMEIKRAAVSMSNGFGSDQDGLNQTMNIVLFGQRRANDVELFETRNRVYCRFS
jgi:hypothetical protein